MRVFIRIPYTSVADPGCLSRIPDPTFFHPGSRIRTVSIPDPGSSSKNLSILTQKKAIKWFLSSKKYDPGCSSRIPDPDADFLPSLIPDPGVKKVPNPGSRIPDPDPQHCRILDPNFSFPDQKESGSRIRNTGGMILVEIYSKLK